MRSTEINEASSRSHLLISFFFHFTDPRTGKEIVGKITFIDLAGSERVAKIVLTEYLYEEAIFINESLKYLGYVIRRLADNRHPELIDFNRHPLTCMVQDTLGIGCKTLVMVNISPSIMTSKPRCKPSDLHSRRAELKFALALLILKR